MVDLDALAQAARKVAAAWAKAAPAFEGLVEEVLIEGSRQSRRRFVPCAGCADCAEPLPVLAGDVP